MSAIYAIARNLVEVLCPVFCAAAGGQADVRKSMLPPETMLKFMFCAAVS